MRVACFSTQPHDQQFLVTAAQSETLEWTFFETRLDLHTASLAAGHQAVCCSVNDELSRDTLTRIYQLGVRSVAMRCSGFNNLDLQSCATLGIRVARVPTYSPHAVAEHTIGLLLSLNRRLHKAFNRVREGNFALHGLLGFELHQKTVGVVGTGKIGRVVVDILQGFGCRVVAHDLNPSRDDIEYLPLSQLLEVSRIVTLHCPLTPQSHHMINRETLDRMPRGTILVNTSRAGLVDTGAVIDALKSGHLEGLAIDVYEEEGDLFFQDLSNRVIQSDTLARLQTFPNVVMTGHQAVFTQEALSAIAATTVENLVKFAENRRCQNEITLEAAHPEAALESNV
jgi:D-lactate dehydrogenase